MLGIAIGRATIGISGARFAFPLIGLAVALGGLTGHVPAAEAGGGACHSPLAREGNDGTVTLEGFCFVPTVMRVQTHTSVHFRNTDPVPHLVTGAANAWGGQEQLPSGAAFEATFDAPGLYPYSCLLHPGMTGVVVVGDGVFASSPGVPAIKALSAGSASGQPDSGLVSASVAAPERATDSRWRYAGMGALGGLAVAGLGFVAVSSKRRGSG
jgi:plastocyanin